MSSEDSSSNKPTRENFSSEDISSNDETSKFKKLKKTLCKLSPFTKAYKMPSTRGRYRAKAQSAVVIMSSPYKLQLEQSKSSLKKEKPKKAIIFSKEQDENQYEDDPNWFSILCGEVMEEDMIQCMHCKSWVHTGCTNVKSSITKYFYTDCK